MIITRRTLLLGLLLAPAAVVFVVSEEAEAEAEDENELVPSIESEAGDDEYDGELDIEELLDMEGDDEYGGGIDDLFAGFGGLAGGDDDMWMTDDDGFGDPFGALAVLADYQEVARDATALCITSNPDIVAFLFAEDPVAAVLDHFSTNNYMCNGHESDIFTDALDGFEECSGMNMKMFIETIFGAVIGASMHCSKYIYDTTTVMMNTLLYGGEFAEIKYPLPRMPEDCAQSLYGDNPFGNMMRYYSENPSKDTICFKRLSEELPSCTLNQWPIPIVGMYLKVASCFYGAAEPILEESCRRELGVLNSCLPSQDYTAKYQCDKVIQDCVKGEQDAMSLEGLMSLPPPLLGRPLSDTCKKVATDTMDLASVLGKYEKFRSYCVSDDDRAIWSIVPSSTIESTTSLAEQVEAAQPLPVGSATNKTKKTNGGGSGSFFGGLIVGAVLSVGGVALFGHLKRSRGYGDRTTYSSGGSYDQVELQIT